MATLTLFKAHTNVDETYVRLLFLGLLLDKFTRRLQTTKALHIVWSVELMLVSYMMSLKFDVFISQACTESLLVRVDPHVPAYGLDRVLTKTEQPWSMRKLKQEKIRGSGD